MTREGTRIGPYEMQRMLGSGATAEVWLARHTSLDTPRALKIVTRDTPGVRERAFCEAQTLAAVGHPGVVAVHDLLEHDGQPVIVQEYVDGPDLDAWAIGRPHRDAVERVMCDVLEALGGLHDAGVIHRDLKPSNILISRSGEVRLADFGLARQGASRGHTLAGALMGTPAYMAPEQAEDAVSATPRSDLFSVGVIAAYLLTGESPFQREGVRETLIAVADCESNILDFLDRHGLDRSDRIVRLLLALVRFDPEDRPATWAEARAMLECPEVSLAATTDLWATGVPAPRSLMEYEPIPTLSVLGGVVAALGGAAVAAVVLLVTVFAVDALMFDTQAVATGTPAIQVVSGHGTIEPVRHEVPGRAGLFGFLRAKRAR
ncbi:MAG: serine/threonine-protein kinase [Myxococcota bacterium]